MAANTILNTYTVGTSAIPICGPSFNRIAVIIGQPSVGRVTVSPRSDVTDLNGTVIGMGDPPLNWHKCEKGCIVQDYIYAAADAAGRTISVTEIIDDGNKP